MLLGRLTLEEKGLVLLKLLGHRRPGRVLFDPMGIRHHVGDADHQPAEQDHEPGDNPVSERNTRRIGRNDRRERVDCRAKHANAGTDQNDRHASNRVIPGRHHHGYQQGIERQRLLGHAIGRTACGEEGHQDRDHPDLVALQMHHRRADARINGARGVHYPEKAPKKEHEQRHIDCIGSITVRIIETRTGCQHHHSLSIERIHWCGGAGGRCRGRGSANVAWGFSAGGC